MRTRYNVLFSLRRSLHTTSLALLLSAFLLPALALAQEPDEGDVRTVVPPDQLVSFAPSTPFDQFVEFVNPIFKRVTGKTIVDPEDRTQAIGVDISRAQFLDAFELVLQANGLTYRETESAFIVQQAQTPPEDQETTARPGDEKALATLTSREVRINALFFQVNRSKARQLGLDWGFLFGGGEGGGQGGGGGGGGGGQGDQGGQRTGLNILVQTEDIFENLDEFIIGPDQIALSTLTQLFRFLESNNAGETVANPSVTVQSGQQGRIQIGSDVPIQTRDFAGNTITEFFSTGVIVEVTPTYITEAVADSLGAPEVDFVHLDVRVENSSSRPTGGGGAPAIDRNTAETQVLLLDGEQTMIGGLYSTERNVTRGGIPLLKDLPAWFFGLRYLFGYEEVNTVQTELMIVLQAEVLEPLEDRADEALPEELLQKRRERIRELLQQWSEKKAEETETPPESY